jgi:hypothetical protein
MRPELSPSYTSSCRVHLVLGQLSRAKPHRLSSGNLYGFPALRVTPSGHDIEEAEASDTNIIFRRKSIEDRLDYHIQRAAP